MNLQRLTAAVLVRKGEKFLLARRNKKNAYGKWIIPGGGVRWGETMENTGLRELKEETNIDAELIKFLCFKEIVRPDVDYHRVVFFFLAKTLNENIKPVGDISEARFFTIDEIKNLEIVESVEYVLKQAGFWK